MWTFDVAFYYNVYVTEPGINLFKGQLSMKGKRLNGICADFSREKIA